MVAPKAQPPLLDLIDELLAEQGRLQTPAARAGEHFDQFQNRHSKLQNFQSLIPLSAPGPGEQYAFEVDLDSCTGCKACVVACHSLNGLDETEAWRDVGCITGGTRSAPYQQTVTTACHHCADPGCLNGCPVLAYEKDPLTGIVRHLDDQCIGCQYCVLKCPYDVPKYNERLGIVRKCDMCHQRLAVGEAPACAQACPTHAIKIVTVSVAGSGTATPRADTAAFLSVAPKPHYTQPTTRYLTRRAQPTDTKAADAEVLRPQHPHWPLVLMLVFTQAAVGLHAASLSITYYVTLSSAAWLGWSALGCAAFGLVCSVAHLGQPLRAWRIFLGLRKSWLSREAVVFGAWFPLLGLSVATDLFAPWTDLAALAIGVIGVFCSAMIYIDTHRVAWRTTQSLPRFFGTALVAGTAGIALAQSNALALLCVGALLGKLAVEFQAVRPAHDHDRDDALTPELATARLITLRFHRIWGARMFGIAAAVLMIALPLMGAIADTGIVRLAAFAIFIGGGELAERYLYFRTVDAPKMPGQPTIIKGSHA